MGKNGLVILSIGLFTIMMAGNGEGEKVNYLILISGLFISAVGTFIVFRKKAEAKKELR